MGAGGRAVVGLPQGRTGGESDQYPLWIGSGLLAGFTKGVCTHIEIPRTSSGTEASTFDFAQYARRTTW